MGDLAQNTNELIIMIDINYCSFIIIVCYFYYEVNKSYCSFILIIIVMYQRCCQFRNGHVHLVEASATAVFVVGVGAKVALVYSFTWPVKGATMMSTLTSKGELLFSLSYFKKTNKT